MTIKFQFSKMVTIILLLMNFATWLIILINTWGNLDYIHVLSDFITTTTVSVMPYFALTVADRIQYALQGWKGGSK